MPFNLRFAVNVVGFHARLGLLAAWTSAGWLMVMSAVAFANGEGESTADQSSAPAWPADARRALDVWGTATTTEEKLSALEELGSLADSHPLVLAATTSELRSGDPPVQARLLEIMAHARTVSTQDLLALKDADSVTLRRAALSALRLQGTQSCEAFLGDADSSIVQAAMEGIYDDRLEGAWPALIATGLDPGRMLNPAARTRAIAAAWHTGGIAEADRLASWLAETPTALHDDTSNPAPRLALRALLGWNSPPERDPLDADRSFHARPRPVAQCWPALEHHESALAAWAGELGGTEAIAWNSWRSKLADAPKSQPEVIAFLADPAHPDGERLHHFQAWLNATGDPGAFAAIASAALTAPEAPAVRTAARAWLFRQHGQGGVPWLLQSLATATATEKQAAIRLIDDHRSADAQAHLLRLLDQARVGLVDPAVIPEVVEAIERRARAEGAESRTFRTALDSWRASQPPSLGDPLRPWRPALEPGDPEAGRALFFSEFTRCTTCHRSKRTSDSDVPPLEGVGSRLDGPALLEALVLPTDPSARQIHPAPPDGGCRPMGTVLTLRELRDLLAYLRSMP